VSQDPYAVLKGLGTPETLFRRVNDADVKRSEVEDEDDWDLDEDLSGALVLSDGFRFASTLAAATADTGAFGWLVWACSAANEDGWEADESGSAVVAARHLATWLERCAEREGPEAIAAKSARLAAHPLPRLRAAAAAVLASLGDAPALADTLRALRHDPEPSVRWAARPADGAAAPGLLPIDADPALAAELEALDPEHRQALDPRKIRYADHHGGTKPEAFEAAIAALSDGLAAVVLPRLVECSPMPSWWEARLLTAMLKRPGGAEAFVTLMPRMEATAAWEFAWQRPAQSAFGALDAAGKQRVADVFLAAVEATLPPRETPLKGFHGARFLATLLENLAPVDPAPIRALLERAGPLEPRDFGARWMALTSLKRALAASEGEVPA
jgi:hypothetical protein